MRLPKEIQILLALLFMMIGGVLWYVIDRRSKNHAAPTPAAQPVTPARP